MKLAVDYKEKFKKDIMLDLICYRKYGHNEVDEPEFTQPKMYHKIRKTHQPSPGKYWQQLKEEGLVGEDFNAKVREQANQHWEQEYQQANQSDALPLGDMTNPQNTGCNRAFTEQWQGFVPSQRGE